MEPDAMDPGGPSRQIHVQRWRDGRHWAVYDQDGCLVVVTVYRKGAEEVVRRLAAAERVSSQR